MFDQIADRCIADDLGYSVWVDDLTISGERIAGELIATVRQIIADNGLRSHKLKSFTGNKAVFITGVGIVGSRLIVPNYYELKSKELWADLHSANSFDEIDTASVRLLSHLGGIRAVVGPKSKRGQKIASELNSIRQKRSKAYRLHSARLEEERKLRANSNVHSDTQKSEKGVSAIPF